MYLETLYFTGFSKTLGNISGHPRSSFYSIRDAEVAGSNPVASTSYKKVGNTEKIKVSGLFLFLEQACKSVRKVCLRMFVKCVLRFVLKNVLKFGLVISKMAYEKSVHYIEKPIATFTDYRFHSFILNFLFV